MARFARDCRLPPLTRLWTPRVRAMRSMELIWPRGFAAVLRRRRRRTDLWSALELSHMQAPSCLNQYRIRAIRDDVPAAYLSIPLIDHSNRINESTVSWC